jgi:hypothetical protein
MLGRQGGGGRLDSDAIDAFFGALDRLDMERLTRLRSAWHSITREAHEAAWAEVNAVAAEEGLSWQIDRLRNRALAWTQRGSPSPGRSLPDYQIWIETKIGAAEAIVDAALAVALGDRLGASTRTVLLGPWIGVAGEGTLVHNQEALKEERRR